MTRMPLAMETPSTTTAPVIELDSVQKRYGKFLALDGMSVKVPSGPVGLLGPNGAGKTTLIKILLGLLRANRGSVQVLGKRPKSRAGRLAIRTVVGYMPESDCLIPGLNAVELVSTLGRLTGLARNDSMTRAHEVLDYVGLEEARYRNLEEYSTGMKQRLKLAQALVHDPQLLLLDEPTNGLDPRGRKEMLELVHDLGHNQGKDVLLCSHLLPDVERTCRDVIVLNKGRIAQSGSIAEMTQVADNEVSVVIRGDVAAFERELESLGFGYKAKERAAVANGGEVRSLSGSGAYRVQLPAQAENSDSVLGAVDRAGCALLSMDRIQSSLDDVFLRLLRDGGAN